MGYLWKHCYTCNAELKHPDDHELLAGSTRCRECGTEHVIDADERRGAAQRLLDRLAAAEERIANANLEG